MPKNIHDVVRNGKLSHFKQVYISSKIYSYSYGEPDIFKEKKDASVKFFRVDIFL